jgi:hypothetical protein
MSQRLYEKVCRLIQEWEPEEIYDVENEFRDDLLDFLDENLNSSDVSIKKEDGRGLCDIGINRQIGIELKLDMVKKAEANRLVGQILDYIDEYPTGIIILLLGDTEHNAFQTVKDGIRKIQAEDQIVRILRKELEDSDDDERDDQDSQQSSQSSIGFFPDDIDKLYERQNEEAKRIFL